MGDPIQQNDSKEAKSAQQVIAGQPSENYLSRIDSYCDEDDIIMVSSEDDEEITCYCNLKTEI